MLMITPAEFGKLREKLRKSAYSEDSRSTIGNIMSEDGNGGRPGTCKSVFISLKLLVVAL